MLLSGVRDLGVVMGDNMTFDAQLEEVVEVFPTLSITGNSERHLVGYIDIIDTVGKHWDTFEVEIRATNEYPYRFPKIYEIGGKIPRIPDWHINGDGSCCVDVEPEEIIACMNGISVLDFLKNHGLPHLSNQAHRRAEGYYKNGEYSHGTSGIIQYYKGILKVDDNYDILMHLKYIGTHGRPNRVAKCYCGSGDKFRHCHRDAFDRIKHIPEHIIKKHYDSISAIFPS